VLRQVEAAIANGKTRVVVPQPLFDVSGRCENGHFIARYLPDPESGIICGAPCASSFTVNVPMCALVSGAVNATEALQLLPGANVLMH